MEWRCSGCGSMRKEACICNIDIEIELEDFDGGTK